MQGVVFGESWILNMPLPFGVRMRFQQKPLKHHASGGLAHREHQVHPAASLYAFHDYLVRIGWKEYAHQLHG